MEGGCLGGSPCRMSIIRNGNVALSNVRKGCVNLSNFRKGHVALSTFKKGPCRMALKPKNGRVAVSILGVYTHYGDFYVCYLQLFLINSKSITA